VSTIEWTDKLFKGVLHQRCSWSRFSWT